MSIPLHVLLVEDSEDDARLLMLELRRGGYAPALQRVDTSEAMQSALVERMWDVVISDYAMPNFNALAALKATRQSGLDVPFIVVSGAIGEQVAVDLMRSGAHDYVMKDNLARLVPAIRRELDEARMRAERREFEASLERARRLETLGELAGRVAHDLNNMLMPLVAYPDLILNQVPASGQVREDILRMQEAAERAAVVVQDLLTLARRGAYRMSPLSLNLVVKAYLRSPTLTDLAARYPNVSVSTELAPDISYLLGSSPHLSKVIMNLVSNAFEALPDGGEIKISTANESLDRAFLGYSHISAGDYAVLRVSDTGVGIPEADMDRIFEPFYTKKEMGRSGSGLGLAVVYGVVSDHKGRIDVRSTVGIGSEFALYFPVTRETLTETSEDSGSYRGSETVLVVDDVEEQRCIAARLLFSLGYRVVTAVNGREAVRYVGQHHVDILVLDMAMEDDFDGLDTFREIVKLQPGQKAILASGFSETNRVRETQRLGAGQFVRKPYTLGRIGKAVRQELDAC